ncbi:MAG: lamin tail domain-containing protein, partial [Ignavibacteriales bacterium]|nr:lamin tail domain-containing protein [Ignavibacteriales bacterium]
MKNIKTILIFLFVFYCNFLLAQSDTSLTLSEVMFKPASGSTNSEFVEIYNTSLTDSFNLIGYKIKYYTSTPEIIIAVTGDSIIKPGQLAVVFENDYDLLNGIYKDIIPAGALVLK